MTENQLQRSCMLYASTLGLLVYHFQAANYQLPNAQHVDSGVPVGWPDLTIIDPSTSKAAFVELKVGKNQPTERQRHFLSVLPNAHLCRDLSTFKNVVNQIFKK